MTVRAFFSARPARTDAEPCPPGFAGPLAAAVTAAAAFLLAMKIWPGGAFDPCRRMLSALGRTDVRLVTYPWSHFLFTFGLLTGAWGTARAVRRAGLSPWGAALHVAGLLTIAAIPENTSMPFHNLGCWLAAAGGGVLWWDWFRRTPSRSARIGWTLALLGSLAALGAGLACHGVGWTAFAPWVPTAQKAVILSFTLWILHVSWGRATRGKTFAACAAAAGLAVFAAALFLPRARPARPTVPAPAAPAALPLDADERAALAWLAYVTGPLPAAEERAWWDVGGRQFGIFSKRYPIAFAGYAAAALGLRGTAAEWRQAGEILGHCLRRYLAPEVWAYTQSRAYWGGKPWAPDPCYRENVMYTGHLLQLLALYEWFTGDDRYWRTGFDFVWKDGRRVHYTVRKLIDVTVEQMRKGATGGVTCEPGLLFFPCNNHPQIALKIFAALGHGDWSADARRWESWALAHFLHPAFGGGAFNLVYHVRGGFFYPRGQSALDGWSLAWYEPWAADRGTACALWRVAAAAIDWSALEAADDTRGGLGCCDPQPVSPAVTAVFLAAAARACGDAATAERLERAVDARWLQRENGRWYLAVDQAWRTGTSAMRILARAFARGSRFRDLCFPPQGR